jgi:hypothetical protein
LRRSKLAAQVAVVVLVALVAPQAGAVAPERLAALVALVAPADVVAVALAVLRGSKSRSTTDGAMAQSIREAFRLTAVGCNCARASLV